MNIDLIQGSLPLTPNPGLDSTDPRFDDIVTLIHAGQHALAASQCETLLAEGIYDIRLICYFLYGYWLEHGLTSLLQLVDSLNNLFQENWLAVGPAGSRKISHEKSLDWLLRQLLKTIKYEESKNTPLWLQWQAATDAEAVKAILLAGAAFRANVNRQLEERAGAVIDQWSKIEQWLRSFQQLQQQQPAAEKNVVQSAGLASDAAAGTSLRPAAAHTAGLEIEVSYHLQQLLKKLAGFERLLAENQLPRAALLASDINQTLQAFDPALYFPQLFASFVRLQALNYEKLAASRDQRNDLQWQAMQEWLKVDVDSFVGYSGTEVK
jgi:hypothetical protein